MVLQRKHIFARANKSFPPALWWLGFGSFINVAGLSLLWPVNAIYIHVQLGKPMAVAGLVLMLYSGAGFLGSFAGGWLYDKIGAFPVLVLGLSVSAASICVPVFCHSWLVYIAVMAVFGFACAIPFAVLSALAGHAWPSGGRRAFNFLYVANNLGVAVGTAVGGVIAAVSFQAVFIGIALAYTLFILMVFTVYRRLFRAIHVQMNNVPQVDSQSPQLQEAKGAWSAPLQMSTAIPWGLLLVLFAGFILSWAIYVQWQCTISVYMQALGYPLSSYSVLWTLNGVLIFVLQPLVAKAVARYPRLSTHMMAGVVTFAVSFTILLFSHAYVAFLVSMVLMTFGEVFIWPAVPAAVARVAPAHQLGLLQGMVGSAATFGRMLGPVIGGVLYDSGSAHLVLFWASIGAILPLLFFVVFRHQEYPESPVASVCNVDV